MSSVPCQGQMALVLAVSYSGVLGGAERVLLDVGSALEGEVCLACPEGALADAARAAGVRVLPVPTRALELRGEPLRAGARLLTHGLEIRRLARDLGADLVILGGMRSALGALVWRPIAQRSVFLHGDMLSGPCVARAVRAAASRAELVVVPSQAVADDLGRRARPVVIHPGVDVDRFAAAGSPVLPPEILVLGAIVEWKRIDLALEAVALARRSRPELRLRIAGAPLGDGGLELFERLRARAMRPDLRGAVEFVGGVSDVPSELERSSCLLHCAAREPFGLAVAEALACGRPAVVPDAGGPAEIVDEGCGVRYPPGDGDAAGRALLDVLSDRERARRMGRRGLERARACFSASRARRQFAAAVDPLTRRRATAATGSLALLTVTHNSAVDLRALLASVERHLPLARVVVVDSGSRDDSVAVARCADVTTVIPLSENVGFGRACNRGLSAVQEAVTVLVNPDVELLDDSLGSLALEVARRDRPERLLAPLVLSSDGSRQDSAHPRPLSLADLVRAAIPPAAVPGRTGVGLALAPWRARGPRAVGWAVGCALVARTETLRALGPFDERIFLYGEDLDLGLAAAERGIRTWFWPTARVLHRGSHASGPAFGGEPFELLARARHDVLARRLGPRRARLDDGVQAATFISRIALKRALGRSAVRERGQLAALAAVSR